MFYFRDSSPLELFLQQEMNVVVRVCFNILLVNSACFEMFLSSPLRGKIRDELYLFSFTLLVYDGRGEKPPQHKLLEDKYERKGIGS